MVWHVQDIDCMVGAWFSTIGHVRDSRLRAGKMHGIKGNGSAWH